jgi:hypothetical protein
VPTSVVNWSEGFRNKVSIITRRYTDHIKLDAVSVIISSYILFVLFCTILRIVIRFVCCLILYIMCSYCYVYVMLLCMFRSVYSVSHRIMSCHIITNWQQTLLSLYLTMHYPVVRR